MKIFAKIAIISLFAAAMLLPAASAFASSPYLSVTNQGGNTVQLNITNANSYSLVTLYRRQSTSLWTVITNIGTTDASGSLNQQMSLGSNGSGDPVDQYVVVGGLQSNTVSTYPNGGGCIYNCNGTLSLSQTSINLSMGQSTSVTAYNSSGSLSVSGNTNSSVASYAINGSQITVYGNSIGSTNLTVCGNNGCGTLFVAVNSSTAYGNNSVGIYDDYFSPKITTVSAGSTVVWTNYGSVKHTVTADDGSFNSGILNQGATFSQAFNNSGTYAYHCVCYGAAGGTGMSGQIIVTGNASGGAITLSQSSVNLNLNQTSTITVNNNYGSLYISNNTNSSVVSASVNGNSIFLSALSPGSATITACANSSSQCASVYVTVAGGTSGSITFSQSTVAMSINQSSTIYAYSTYNSGNSFYISSNSNSNVVNASVSGSVITLYANSNGNSTISVCQNNSSSCSSFYVTVGGGSNGNVTLSQNNISITSGQSSTVYAYSSGNNYYISNNSNPGVVTASVSGSVVSVYGVSAGNTTISVCSSNGNGCASLSVNVGGYLYNNSNVSLSQNTVSLNSGQSMNVNIYGNGSYYVSSNSNPSVASASVSGSTVTVFGNSSGSSTLSICQSSYNSCGTLYVTVNGNVLGTNTYTNGQLINQNGTIYITYKNSLTAFGNRSAFEELGFSFDNVVSAYSVNMPITGYVISTSKASHPWGSWVKSGSTIYFVHELGLIPVGDYSTFLNNGGQDSAVVPANAWDFSRPILSLMGPNDSRLR